MTGVRRFLDDLDAAVVNAALGSLRVGEHYGIHLYAGENPVGTTLRAADAAAIVAAVNALPSLTSVLRQLDHLADELDGWQENARRFGAAHPEVSAVAKARELAYRRAADRIRAVLAPLTDPDSSTERTRS